MFLKNGIGLVSMLASPSNKNKEKDKEEEEESKKKAALTVNNSNNINNLFFNVLIKSEYPSLNEKSNILNLDKHKRPINQLKTDNSEHYASSSRDIIKKNSSELLPKINTISFGKTLEFEISDGKILFFKSLSQEHYFFKPFCGLSEYEPFSLYLSILIFRLFLGLVINALLITNKDISLRYHDDIAVSNYFLRAFYVSLIEIIVNIAIKSLTNIFGVFAVLVQEQKQNEKLQGDSLNKMREHYSSKIRCKLIIFYVIEISLSLLFGYYLSTFCYTYSHSLGLWIITFVISTFFSIIYSIVYCSILVLTTIYGSKYHSSCVYKFAICLQSKLLK